MTVITDRKAFEKAVPILATDARRLGKAAGVPGERRAALGRDVQASTPRPTRCCLVPDGEGRHRVRAGGRARRARSVGPRVPAVEASARALRARQGTGRHRAGERRVRVGPGRLPVRALPQARSASPRTCSSRTRARGRGARHGAGRAPRARPREHARGGHGPRGALRRGARAGRALRRRNSTSGWATSSSRRTSRRSTPWGARPSAAPRLLEIHWGNRGIRALAVVGKGVCFDSGGLDIKTAEGMRLMKKDMGGAAHALALARLVMQREPARAPARADSRGGERDRRERLSAGRRGAHAQGAHRRDRQHRCGRRVILADALAYAAEQKPKTIVDFATLTGRGARGAGAGAAGAVLQRREARREAHRGRARGSTIRMWRLPLWRNYRRLFSSDIADFSNSGKGGLRRLHRGRALPRPLRAARHPLGALRRLRVERRRRAPAGPPAARRRACARCSPRSPIEISARPPGEDRRRLVKKLAVVLALAPAGAAAYWAYESLDLHRARGPRALRARGDGRGGDESGAWTSRPRDGRGVVRGLEIGSPAGFAAPRTARVGEIRSWCSIRRRSREPVVHMREITVESPLITYERTDRGTQPRGDPEEHRAPHRGRAAAPRRRAPPKRSRAGASSSSTASRCAGAR